MSCSDSVNLVDEPAAPPNGAKHWPVPQPRSASSRTIASQQSLSSGSRATALPDEHPRLLAAERAATGLEGFIQKGQVKDIRAADTGASRRGWPARATPPVQFGGNRAAIEIIDAGRHVDEIV